jgi:hypothetical protein
MREKDEPATSFDDSRQSLYAPVKREETAYRATMIVDRTRLRPVPWKYTGPSSLAPGIHSSVPSS